MSDAPDPLGKRALFWAPGALHDEDSPPLPGRERTITGKRALFSAAVEPAPEGRPPVPADGAGPGRLLPPVSVHCSWCGSQTDVQVTEFLALHIPFFLWRPGRGFTRFMTCPSCHRRSWVSASWTPWSSR